MALKGALGELRFLVVEDQGFQLWITAKMLEDLGARYVLSAPDGAKALQIVAEREPPIDLIITDIDMPGMDGMEFLRHLGAANHPASVILASALEPRLLNGIEAMARAYNLAVLGAVSKPLTAKKLSAVIARHADRPPFQATEVTPTFTASQLAAALERHEFVAYFQPKIDLITREMRGAEALARWKSPLHGVVRPASFIGAMEDHRLIEALTTSILQQAAANCVRWRGASIDATVSVNISAPCLASMDFSNRVLRTVEECGLEPRRVILEVTESANVTDRGSLLENLSRLRMNGFGLSIDDFGTGHSSMERLAGVPFTELKIDQSFVRLALTHGPSRAMLESSLEMARKLGITAVAEGIECRAEWELVRSLGCDLAQGYFIQRPVDADEFHAWLRAPSRISA